jgi:transcription termination/antitermination protein NusG
LTSTPESPSTATTGLAWYVIHVFTGQEEKIKAFLNEEVKRLKLEDQITQVLIPKEEVIEMRDGKKKAKTRVFFPGYMMVEMQLNKSTEHLLLNTPQVINFVGPKNRPQALRKAEVDRILGHVDRAGGTQVVEVPFSVGDSIKVIDGPFKDFTGVVRDINLEKRKVKVMVSIFGRSTPIELDFLQVSTDLTT